MDHDVVDQVRQDVSELRFVVGVGPALAHVGDPLFEAGPQRGMTAQLVTNARMMAIWRRGKPDALLHHSNQGSQCTSEQFWRRMTDNGVTCLMSWSGNVWDNAAMEGFFSSLKTQRIGRKPYRTRHHAKADVFDYVERFYNSMRRHSPLVDLSPMDFERQARVA